MAKRKRGITGNAANKTYAKQKRQKRAELTEDAKEIILHKETERRRNSRKALSHGPLFKHGNKYFTVFKVVGDGNCLFSAISYCLYGNCNANSRIRKEAVNWRAGVGERQRAGGGAP